MAAEEKPRCREPSPESPNKRPKPEDPLNSSPQINNESNSSSSKIDDVCGICLLEAISQDCCVSRGCLDSCDHFFCFVCIMEWAKIDSKCPLCKRRFSVIRRPPKPPVFPTERIVQVPVRDQVFNGIGNVTTGPFDRYSDSKCSVCQGKEDDSLLLLCDLCDSASHTYCVGLGANVPDGDWFCPDCALLKAEQAKNDQMESDCCNPIISRNSTDSKSGNVSIFDIVQGPSGRSRGYTTGLYSTIRTSSDTRAQVRVVHGQDERDVRTLQRCRNVNRRIQVLRGNMALNIGIPSVSSTRPRSSMQDAKEQNTSNVHQQRLQCLRDNWTNIRAGSLGFSDNVDNARTVHAKIDVGAHSHQPTSTSNSCQQSKSKKGPTVGTTGAGSSDRDKAWKMMKFAKSLEQRKNSTSQVSKVLSPKVQEVWPVNAASTSQGKQNSRQNIAEVGKTHGDTRPETKNGHTELSQNVNIRVPDSLRMHEAMQYGLEVCSKGNSADKIMSKVPSTGSSIRGMSVCMSSSVQPAHTVHKSNLANFEQSTLTTRSLASMKTNETCDAKSEIKSFYGLDVCRKANSADKIWSKVPFTGSSVRGMSASSSSSVQSAQTVQKSNHADLEQSTLTTRSLASMKTKETSDAKSEIKSLVKLNLKILTKTKKLEVDAFKDVARLATHSILAACGLEIPKPGISHFNNCVCHHPGDVQIHRSTLMPNSCRECFYNFVQNVVNIIMSERIGSNNSNEAAFPILYH